MSTGESAELKKELDALKKELISGIISEAERIAVRQQIGALERRRNLLLQLQLQQFQQTSSNNNNNASAAAASTSPSKTTSITAEEAEKLLQEAAPLFTASKYSEAIDLYSKVVDAISLNEDDASLKQILSRALSNRSGSFLGLKKSKNALVDARRCVDVRPSWVRGHLRVAAAAEELEEVDVVVSAYQAAIKAEDRSGNVPPNKVLETSILRVQQKHFNSLMKQVHRPDVSRATARDALISSAKYCTCTESADSFSASISKLTNLAGYNEANTVLFGTAAVRDAMMAVSKYCTNADSVGFFCMSIVAVTMNNKTNTVLFGTASVRDALVAVSKYCTEVESVGFFCTTIDILSDNDKNRIVFGTVSVRDAIVARSKYCTAPPSAGSFCKAIVKLAANENNRIIFGTASVRDALLTVSKYCTTSQSLLNESRRVLFGTASVRDAMLTVSKYCTDAESAGYFFIAIDIIIYQNESNLLLFGTEAIRGAILSASAHINDSRGVCCCSRAIYVFQETKPTLFCVKQTVTSLVKLSKIEMKKQSPESIFWFLSTILTLLHSDKKLFNTTEIRNAVERFQKVVNDPDQVEKLEKKTAVLDKLSNEYLDKARQLCVEFQKVVNEKSVASSADAAASSDAACVD